MKPRPRCYIFNLNGKLIQKTIDGLKEHFEVCVLVNGPVAAEMNFTGAEDFVIVSVEQSYSQLNNLVLHIENNIAKSDPDRAYPWFATSHDDCYVREPQHLPALIDWVDAEHAKDPKWWCAYTSYDCLAAWNRHAFNDVGPWDQTFPLYFCDFDNQARFGAAGYKAIQSPFGHIVFHEPSQTHKSDPRRKFLNGVTFPHYQQIYMEKWGGHPAKFTRPFDGRMP